MLDAWIYTVLYPPQSALTFTDNTVNEFPPPSPET